MSKPLFMLCAKFEGHMLALSFDNYETLLASLSIIKAAEIPAVVVEEDATTRHLFDSPTAALEHVKLWVAAVKGVMPEEVSSTNAAADLVQVLSTAAPARAKMRPRHREVLNLLRRPEGVTLEEITNTMGILPASASALISVATRAHGVTVAKRGDSYHVAGRRVARAGPRKRSTSRK